MKKVIEKYKKVIFVYVLVNCVALTVNLLRLYYEIQVNSTTWVYPLTNHIPFTFDNGLWPFVQFETTSFKGYPSESISFNGIFYQYDWGEFALYIGLLIIFLVYKSYIATPKVKVPSD